MTDLGNQSKNNFTIRKSGVLVSQDGARNLWQWQIMMIYFGGDNLTRRLWGHNKKISLHMVVRRITKCWWIITTFLVGNDLWMYKVVYTCWGQVRDPPPPLSHMAISSTNTWVGLTHFTDDFCTGHLNFGIIKWNNLGLAKKSKSFGKNCKASRLIRNYASEISRSDQNFVRPRSGHVQMTYDDVMLRIKVLFVCQ